VRVRVDVVEELGAETHVIFPLDAPRVVAEAVKAAADATVDDDGAPFVDDQRAQFTAVVDGHRPVAPGTEIELAVETGRIHFFDPATGAVLGTRD
jgi:multiple sugar transport system ATP-binding protein